MPRTCAILPWERFYYYPDTANPGHYTTGPRYFYDFAAGGLITK